MRIYIWSFGRTNAMGAYASLVEEYTRRMPATLPLKLELFEPIKHSGKKVSKEAIRRAETEFLLKKMQVFVAKYVILDETVGGAWSSSLRFAEFLGDKMQKYERLVFVIGGAFGFDKEIFNRGYSVYSLGKFTYPRYLAILIIAEQIYRASTILYNQKYHH